ncbi:ricin-type beta-trefoil lectin domain protein [Streptomyces sp. NPDC059070]|uniref:ricin-type beta-trefoil lectin domain protein n=1 Tax=Streptomyces sp. NPDC059070 TaxID=3346713 RepID=UPI0036CF1AC9
MAAALTAALLPAQAMAVPPGNPRADVDLIDLQKEKVAKDADTGVLSGLVGPAAEGITEYEPAKTAAPAGGSGQAAIAAPAAGQLVKAGDLPVLVGPPKGATADQAAALVGTWQVQLATPEQTAAADVDGMLLSVTPPAGASGQVEVALDYMDFKQLYSADWADRLRFEQYPPCFLTTPDAEDCNASTGLPSTNDDGSGRITVTLDVSALKAASMAVQQSVALTRGRTADAVFRSSAKAGVLRSMLPAAGTGGAVGVLAAVDSGSGAKGDFTATPLVSAGSWSAGGSSGAFNYQYKVSTPPVSAGPAPDVTFRYNSQVVDGRTSATNNQASWLGDGWEYNPGSIERTYRACADDTANNANNAGHKTGDLCWGSDNAVLSIGGSTVQLVQDDTTHEWVTENGDGSKVELLKNADLNNGDADGEYWRVTARDGTQYYYGLNRLPGWSAGKSETDSVLTVPVAGNQAGEPCHADTFAGSFCDQAWRWNLDYVVDRRGNAMSLWWHKDSNFYAQNKQFTKPVSYDRGGYLTRIDYGQRADTLFTAEPLARVSFGVGERCFAEGTLKCDDAAFASRDYGRYRIWYDTPAHLYCSGEKGKRCPVPSPTFWSRKLLSAVDTSAQRTKGSTTLSPVDTWKLQQAFPRTLTDGSPPLWLKSITRTGYAANGDSARLNAVEFSHNNEPMPNRVVKGSSDPRPAFDRLRIRRVVSEYGGEIDVTYSTPTGDCATGASHPAPESNTGLCFPVSWNPDPDKDDIDWFNKYVVDKIEEKPRIDGVDDVVTQYQYGGGAAWAKNDTEFSKKKTRTYDQWHGYAQVDTLKGTTDSSAGTVRSKSTARYFRGMDGDLLPDGSARKMEVKDSDGDKIADDHPALQGQEAEALAYTQADRGSVATRTVTYPSAHLLATRARGDGLPPLRAYRTQTDKTTAVTPSSGTGDDARTSRTVTVSTQYDDDGLPTQVESLGDTGVTGDETCTLNEYVSNRDANLIGLVKQVRTVTGACGPTSGGAVVNATRTFYDDGAYGATPNWGSPTAEYTVDSAGTDWVLHARTSYDSYGRVTAVEDAAGHKASTSYIPSTGQAYAVTTTNAVGNASTTTVDPARSTALTLTDVNNKVTTYAYDPLGRATKVWRPTQNPINDPAAEKYSYSTSAGKPVAVTHSTLRDDDTYATSTVIYDGLGRERQSQKEAVGGGRLITDTLYNASGTVSRTNNGYLADGEPSTSLFEKQSDFTVPNATVTTHDGMGRPLTVTPYYASIAQDSKRTTYEYGWDFTTVTPPTGAAKTRSYSDVLGRTVRIDHFTGGSPESYTSTRYGYDARGNRISAKDTQNNTWSWQYDARGRQTQAVDPDTGTSTVSYNDLDQPVTATNARGITVWTGYDALGRTTGQRLNNASGTPLTSFTYDQVGDALGQPTSATRYTDGVAYTTTITGYDGEYRPTGKIVTIPDTAAAKGLAGSYGYTYTYTRTGLLQSVTEPAAGGLVQEKVVTRYNQDGLPTSTSGLDWYTAETTYSPFGEVLRAVTGEQPYRVWSTNVFDESSGRLKRTVTDRETADSHRVNDRTYSYDDSGNVTSLTDASPTSDAPDAPVNTDRQCFTYDALGQLTEAWTSPNPGCLASGQGTRAPLVKDASGAVTGTNVTDAGDGYWQTYSYDALGNRTKLVEHKAAPVVSGGKVDTTSDVTSTYAYGIDPSGSGVRKQPHTLTGITSNSKAIDSTASLGYDSTGNTTSRTYGGDTQTLAWTWDGKVEKVSGFGKDGEGQVVGLAGKCLDLDHANTTAGTPLELFSCHGMKSQRFQLDPATTSDATTGALKILANCVMPSGGGTTPGTQISLAACTGAANQNWTKTPGGTLKHTASGLCLDVMGASSDDGTSLQLATCKGSPGQQWSFADETTYVYDATGNRLIASTRGAHTLYLDDTELSTDATGAVSYCQRYYGSAGATVMRQSLRGSATTTLTALATDHHGTAIASITLAAGQQIQRQKSDPFGVERGRTGGQWSTHRGYLGGTDDSGSDLTHLGAREYDASTGHFISADPVLDIADPLQMNGYAYSNNNPVTRSDPTGLMRDGGGDCGARGDCNDDTVTSKTTSGNTTTTTTTTTSGDLQTVTVTVTKTVTVKNKCDWWCKTKGWLRSHKEIVSFTVEVLAGGACYSTAVLGAPETGGASLGAATGCGAVAGAAGAAVNNALDPDADHSTLGVLKAEAGGAALGAVGGAAGAAAERIVSPLAEKLAAKILTSKAAKAGSAAPRAAAAEGSPAASAGGCLTPTHSFLPGTGVLLADGTSKPIEDVNVGDTVLTTDTDTGQTTEKPVVATITTEDDKQFTKLTVKTGKTANETSSITATDTHPFWVPKSGEWINAGELQPGQWLRTSSGTYVQITAVTRYTHQQRTHDLTVQGIHAYYVLAGSVPVLVHNANCKTVAENDAGRFGDLSPGQVGDGLEAHHMPQDGLGFLARSEGGAIVVKQDDHALTRTYRSLGRKTKAAESGLPFRTVLARDIWDLRRIGQQQYGDPSYFNQGIQGLLAYYRKIGIL